MPQMNFIPLLRFQRPPYPQRAPQKSNLETMMKTMLLMQEKQDEYMKQLASKADFLNTYYKMLEAQITKQATSSSTPLGRFPGKNELRLGEQCNAMILRGGSNLRDLRGLAKMSICMMEMMWLLRRGSLLLLLISYAMMCIILKRSLMTQKKISQDLVFHLYYSPKEWLRLSLTNNLGSF